jgi:hypothetical protein
MSESSERHPDLLDIEFEEVFDDEYQQLEDMRSMVFDMVPHNGRDTISYSDIGELGDFQQLEGGIAYDETYDGYETVATYLPWALGTQIERQLIDDDQHHIIAERPRALARSANRTMQGHGAQVYNRAFSVGNDFYTNTEGVALCSNSHTTTSGASTATGFDNLGVTAMNAVSVEAARREMYNFRDDRGNRINVAPDRIVCGPAQEQTAWEIIHSKGKVDTANNNANFQEGAYELLMWKLIQSSSDWFLEDSNLRRNSLKWIDRIPLEHARVEDFDTLAHKYRGYMRYAWLHRDWRWVYGSQVS